MNQDFSLTFRDNYRGLCAFTYRIIGNREDAAEIVQEAFLRLHRVHDRVAHADDRIFLYRVARNLAIDGLRRKQSHKRLLEAHGQILVMPLSESAEDRLVQEERCTHLRKALETLSPRDVECLMLRNEGHSYGDIAAILDVHPGSVGPTLTRALRRLRGAYIETTETGAGRESRAASRSGHP